MPVYLCDTDVYVYMCENHDTISLQWRTQGSAQGAGVPWDNSQLSSSVTNIVTDNG